MNTSLAYIAKLHNIFKNYPNQVRPMIDGNVVMYVPWKGFSLTSKYIYR